NKLKNLTVEGWLFKEKQSDNLRKSFWEIVCVGALNSSTKNASAELFASILKKMFLQGNEAATFIIPKIGLSETYCKPAEEFLLKNEASISLSENVLELIIVDNSVKKIITSKREIEDFDYLISAIPLSALKKFYTDNKLAKIDFENSCIVTIHLWLKENSLSEKFYGLIGSPIHWIFNHGDHISLVISDANYFVDKDKNEIYKMCLDELNKYANITEDNISGFKIIKEKRATFIPSLDVLSKRPGVKTNINNLFLAGDWTDTGLPATLEGAVQSGKIASEIVMKNYNQRSLKPVPTTK
ncbi:MAG: FAD-dependent oxidoreductase, partial [Bacteroidetes bacterium]|nr:FAD-dependent oxidoreductase [Bacteroidota bacterium]